MVFPFASESERKKYLMKYFMWGFYVGLIVITIIIIILMIFFPNFLWGIQNKFRPLASSLYRVVHPSVAKAFTYFRY